MSGPKPDDKTKGVPKQRRALTLDAASANPNTLTVSMIAATETPAIQWIPDPKQTGDFDCRNYIKAFEILDMTGVDFSRAPGMPFADSHDLSSSEHVLGTVFNLRVEGAQLVGEVKFRQRHAELVTDIADGHLQQVSVGYVVNEYQIVSTDQMTGIPTVRAVSWTPHEVSLVPVGADPGAVMRSADQTLYPAPTFSRAAGSEPQENPMDLDALIAAAQAAKSAATDAIAALADADQSGATDDQKAQIEALGVAPAAAETEADDGTRASETDPVDEADKKETEMVRAQAAKRGKDAVAFVESLIGLKRGKEIRQELGDFVATRAKAAAAVPPAMTPVIEQPTQVRGVDLDPSTLFAARKRGFQAAK